MGKLAHLLDRDSPTAKNLAEQLQTSRARDEEWKSMLAEVDTQLSGLHEHLDMVEKKAETDARESERCMDKMAADIAALRKIVTDLITRSTSDLKAAVGNIRMPVIPEQMKTDLTPILRILNAMQEREAMEEKNESEPAEKPEEWVFDIQRGPNGGITKVVAREI